MSIGVGAAASGGVYGPPIKLPGQAQSANPAQTTQQAVKTQSAVAAAQQALASANSIVDQDKRNHSPGCVACDRKLVDNAQVQLAQVKASASNQTAQTLEPGSIIDFIA